MIFLTKMRPVLKSKRPGFTLLELIFVGIILVIITALAVPQFRRTFDSLRLQNFVSDVISFARYAQAKAITDGVVDRLAFDTEKKIFEIDSYAGVKTGDQGAGEIWEKVKSKTIPDFISVSLQDNQTAVKFYPDGTADSAAIKIGAPSGKNFIISIDPLTSYVKVEESPQQ